MRLYYNRSSGGARRVFRILITCAVLGGLVAANVQGDDMIYAYEGNVAPWEDVWIGYACGGGCSHHGNVDYAAATASIAP